MVRESTQTDRHTHTIKVSVKQFSWEGGGNEARAADTLTHAVPRGVRELAKRHRYAGGRGWGSGRAGDLRCSNASECQKRVQASSNTASIGGRCLSLQWEASLKPDRCACWDASQRGSEEWRRERRAGRREVGEVSHTSPYHQRGGSERASGHERI